MFRFEVHGAERIPADGPVVVVAPHRSWLDPACVGGACPRPVRFLIMNKVYRRVWGNLFFRCMRALPVEAGGSRSVASLRGALKLLREGQVVGVFPEGRVMPEGELGPVQPGAALLAARVQAPVIPMVIRGSAKAWPHHGWPRPARVSVHVGAPIQPVGGDGRAAVEAVQRQIEGALRLLFGESGPP